MHPQFAPSTQTVSEKRRIAARANGAKSRGPVTAQGKANSSRNSQRHGLRSQNLFAAPACDAELTALIAALEAEHQPQSQHERTLVQIMALSEWRRTRLYKLETDVLNREFRRLKALTPEENPVALISLAFRSLADHSCALQFINRLEARCERQFDQAFDRLQRMQVESGFRKKMKSERTNPPYC